MSKVSCYVVNERGETSDAHWVRLLYADDYDTVKMKIVDDFGYTTLPESFLHANKIPHF